MSARRIAVVLGVSATVLLGSAGIASASGEVEIPGAKVNFYSSINTLSVTDTANDGNTVYANWETPRGERQRLNNTGGPDTAETQRLPVAEGRTILYRVCVNRAPFQRDRCSGWKEDRV